MNENSIAFFIVSVSRNIKMLFTELKMYLRYTLYNEDKRLLAPFPFSKKVYFRPK